VLLIAANHPFIATNPDYDGYLLVGVWLSAPALGDLVALLWGRRGGLATQAAVALATIIPVLAGALATPAVWTRARRSSHVCRGLAEAALAETPKDGILLVSADHLVFPLLVLQEVEGLRPDVAMVNAGWASSSWYWEHLANRHPGLRDAVRAALAGPRTAALGPRESRLHAFITASGRPLAAESLALASLSGGRPCRGGILSLGASACQARPLADPAAGAESLRRLGDEVEEGSLDERVLAHEALTHADDAWLDGDPAGAWRWLVAGLPAALRRALPPDRPDRPAAPFVTRTVFHEPRALSGPEQLLARLADLAR
jgi:hypothetical protein